MTWGHPPCMMSLRKFVAVDTRESFNKARTDISYRNLDEIKSVSSNAATNKVWVSLHLLSRRFEASKTGEACRKHGCWNSISAGEMPSYLFWTGGHCAFGKIFLEDFYMPGIRRKEYTCNVLFLRLVEDFWAIP